MKKLSKDLPKQTKKLKFDKAKERKSLKYNKIGSETSSMKTNFPPFEAADFLLFVMKMMIIVMNEERTCGG